MEKVDAKIIEQTDTTVSYDIEGRRIDLARNLVETYMKCACLDTDLFIQTIMYPVYFRTPDGMSFADGYDILGKEKCEYYMVERIKKDLRIAHNIII